MIGDGGWMGGCVPLCPLKIMQGHFVRSLNLLNSHAFRLSCAYYKACRLLVFPRYFCTEAHVHHIPRRIASPPDSCFISDDVMSGSFITYIAIYCIIMVLCICTVQRPEGQRSEWGCMLQGLAMDNEFVPKRKMLMFSWKFWFDRYSYSRNSSSSS